MSSLPDAPPFAPLRLAAMDALLLLANACHGGTWA